VFVDGTEEKELFFIYFYNVSLELVKGNKIRLR